MLALRLANALAGQSHSMRFARLARYLNIGGRASTQIPSALPDSATAKTAAIERKPSSARG
jgi:hypothetical protein